MILNLINDLLDLAKIENSSLIIERHLHHFFDGENFDKRVLKHWIPINQAKYKIEEYSGTSLSKFVKIGGFVVCLY